MLFLQVCTALHLKITMRACPQTFFRLWCREFQRLLLYQDQYFGKSPLWVASALDEDGISNFSQECCPRLINAEPCPSIHPGCIQDYANAISEHSSWCKEALQTVPPHISEPQADCTLQFPAASGAEVAGAGEGTAGDQLYICTGPADPPITCAAIANLGALGTRRYPASTKGRWLPGRSSAHGLPKPRGPVLAHSNPVSDLVSISSGVEEKTGVGDDGAGRNTGSKSVSVAEVCRFLFALSLTLDLVLGLLPLLGAVILFYLLQHTVSPYPKSEQLDSFSSSSVCSDATAFTAVFLSFSRSSSFTSMLCAFQHLFLWSLVLTSGVALFYAALLSSQASRFFFPLTHRTNSRQALSGA